MPQQSILIGLVDKFGNLLSGQQVSSESYPVTIASDQIVPIQTTFNPATAPSAINVTSSASLVTLLAANANRQSLLFYNDSSQTLYFKFGAGCSITSFTNKLASQAFYRFNNTPIYTGIITGLWSSANGFLRITEVTP